jgi:hypothetical protein
MTSVANDEEKKPDLREQVGIAVNSSSLVIRARAETALDRVAALGAATLAVQLGADRRYGGSIVDAAAAAIGTPPAAAGRDRLAGELGAILWHIRFGKQEGQVPTAVALFIEWMMDRPQFADTQPETARRLLLKRFAELALHEWLSDKCVACGGSGKLERTRAGLVRPRGTMQRNARFAPCKGCGGNGKARPNHKVRARAFGIPKKWYFDQHWPARFILAERWLSHALASRLLGPLTNQLERRKRHS